MNKHLRILNELRPAAEGFSGIPQETRILHSILLNERQLDVTGLINGHKHILCGLKSAEEVSRGRLLSHAQNLLIVDGGLNASEEKASYRFFVECLKVKIMACLGLPMDIIELNFSLFSDYIWAKYFSKTLAPEDFEKVTLAKYATIKMPWGLLWYLGNRVSYSYFDTAEYDVIVTQNPFPGCFSKKTQHIIRYHDAMPIFYPHTIRNARVNQSNHYWGLKFNLKHGAKVVCNSENSRNQLLSIFPGHEDRVMVIPCVVARSYEEKCVLDSPEQARKSALSEIIYTHINEKTKPSFSNFQEEVRFYDEKLNSSHLEYIIMVSTLEPRKNHLNLIDAWNVLRQLKYTNLKLILVGSLGWGNDAIVERIKVFQNRGLLFHLSGVPVCSLKKLYHSAAAVICPSIAEGFDLSGIEAMFSGGIVIASDIPVHREIYKDGCLYFNPHAATDIVTKIQKVIGPEGFDMRNKLKTLSAKVAEKYTVNHLGPLWSKYFESLQ